MFLGKRKKTSNNHYNNTHSMNVESLKDKKKKVNIYLLLLYISGIINDSTPTNNHNQVGKLRLHGMASPIRRTTSSSRMLLIDISNNSLLLN